MYHADELNTGTPVTLAERLQSDADGTLRDQLVQALMEAEDQVQASLSEPLAAADRAALQPLLGALALAEAELRAAWAASHGARGLR